MHHASQFEPASLSEAVVRGQVLEHAGRLADAPTLTAKGIRRSVDDDFAIGRLIDMCDSRSERVEVLAFIEGELYSPGHLW